MIDIDNLSSEDKIMRAKIRMYNKSPFFSYILLHMKMQRAKKGELPEGNETMGIDHQGNVYWSEEFVNKISNEDLMGVIAHEVLHVALMHMIRAKGRDGRIMNVTQDLVINDILINENFSLPKMGLIPDNHEFKIQLPKKDYIIKNINEKSSEEIYDEIYHLLPVVEELFGVFGSGSGNGLSKNDLKKLKDALTGIDHHKPKVGKSDDSKSKKEKQDWKKIISTAASIAKQQGKLPAGLERMIEGILESKINWKEKLYKYIIAQLPFDYSYNYPNKRGAALGIYLPRIVRESVHIVVSIDTSGSIGQEELKEFMGELLAIGQSFQNLNIDMIICDAEVHEVYELTGDTVEDILSLKMSGGGGTSHIPIYDYVKKNIIDCKVLINFTDGFTSFPEEEPHFDSLWVLGQNSCQEKDIPFGEIIKLEK